MPTLKGYNTQQISQLILDVYTGRINQLKLPLEFYEALNDTLLPVIEESFNPQLIPQAKYDAKISGFTDNIKRFNAAKTFQFITDMQRLAATNPSPAAFQDQAAKIYSIYNEVWLNAEIATTEQMAISAGQYMDAVETKDALPLLEYNTVGDERVRDEHRLLDGIVRPVTDKFWNVHYPPNGWRCRCDVLKREESYQVTMDKDLPSQDQTDKEIPKLFQTNPGKNDFIFKKSHPYFKVPKEYDSYKDNNFNLPL